MLIETRVAGRRSALIPRWETPLPPDLAGRGEPLTLRQVITAIVRAEVAAFHERQRAREFVRALSEREIVEGATRGKIDAGGRPAPAKVEPENAVATALRAFEDGLYLVLIDEREHRRLDEQVALANDSKVTFLRLVMLAGA